MYAGRERFTAYSMLAAGFTVVFWSSLAFIVYTYAGYPLLVAMLGALFPRPRRDPSHEPTVSVLIAAYNEEASIAAKVEETLSLDYPSDKLEVVVVSDGSTDGTNEIMARMANPRVRFFAVPRGGKTNAQNFGVARCRGEIVVFSDATAVYRKDAIRQLVSCFADRRVGAASGFCHFFAADGGKSPTGLGQVLFGGYDQAIRVFQSRIQTATGCTGAIYAVRRDLYVPLPAAACSDMVEPLEIVRRGARVVYCAEAQASESSTRTARDEFRMRVRCATQGIRGLTAAGSMLWGARGWWVAVQLISHKGLRYFLPVPLALLFASSGILASGDGLMLLFFGAQAAFYGVAVATLLAPPGRLGKLFSLPLYFCTGNAAIVAGVIETFRGNRFAVWDTVRQ